MTIGPDLLIGALGVLCMAFSGALYVRLVRTLDVTVSRIERLAERTLELDRQVVEIRTELKHLTPH